MVRYSRGSRDNRDMRETYNTRSFADAASDIDYGRKQYNDYDGYDCDDSYVLEELARINRETNELRRILERRNQQVDQLAKTVEMCGTSSNELVSRIKKETDGLNDRIEELEVAVTDYIDHNSNRVEEKVESSVSSVNDKYIKLIDDMNRKMELMKKDLIDAAMNSGETRKAVEEMQKKLEDKAEKKGLVVLHNKLTTIFAIGIANVAGSVMLLAILCYLIMSIAR